MPVVEGETLGSNGAEGETLGRIETFGRCRRRVLCSRMSSLRRWFPWIALLALAAVAAVQVRTFLVDPTIWPPDDFVEYWAAGRLALDGADPYAPELLLPLQRDAGRDTDEAIMMWNPPWTLPLVLPLGALPARVAQLMWLLVGAAAIAVGVQLFARTLVGGRRTLWLAAAGFVPVYLVLQAGQIGPLLVLGAALACAYAGTRPLLAGAALVLVSVKPHLAYLVWVALIVDAVAARRWKLLGGGIAVGLAFAALPLLFVPQVYHDYLHAMRDHPPAQWVSLTLGTLLRFAFGEGRFGLQFLPMLAGLGWFAWYWLPRRGSWHWGDELPKLLFVSFLTSPYGAWHFDLVLLLIPVLHRLKSLVAAPLSAGVLGCWVAYALMNLAMLGINLGGGYSYWYGWVAPLLLLWDQSCAVAVQRAAEPTEQVKAAFA